MKSTRILFHVFIFSIIYLLLMTPLKLNASTTGKIWGTITDAKTGHALPGANVLIKGTSLGSATDLNGRYVITNVPAGSYTLRITYIGYEQNETLVNVIAGGSVQSDIGLKFVVIGGEEVTVTAQAEGQMAAINQQLAARSIVNVVSSARIQELPDANAAESLGKLPGVAILRSGGEGNKVVIRGLSPQYNNINVNGVRLAATGSGNRSVDLSMISPYMLEGIEVTKAVTPDQDADVLGGTVNFKIKEAKPGFHYDLMAQGGYNGLRGSYNDYKFVLGASNRFLSDKLGVFAQVDIEHRNRDSEQLGASYRLEEHDLDVLNDLYLSSFNLRNVYRDKYRYGGTLVLDYRLPKGKINLTNFASHIDNKTLSRGEAYDIQNNGHNYSTGDSRGTLTVVTNGIKLEQSFSRFRFDAFASHSFSENRSPDNLTFQFVELSAFNDVNERVHPTEAALFAKNDISNTYIDEMSRAYNYMKEQEYSAAMNFEFDLKATKQITGLIKFGGKYRHKYRTYNRDEEFMPISWGGRQEERNLILTEYAWMQETTPIGAGLLPYSLFVDPDYKVSNFLDGDYALGPGASVSFMKDVDKLIDSYYWTHFPNTIGDDYSGTEDYGAGYIMAELNLWSSLTIIPGVRYEYNKTEYSGVRGNTVDLQAWQGYNHHDTTTVRKNDYWLPMVHVRYKPLQWFDVRFAYTNTLSRPGYNQIIPSWNIGVNVVNWNNYQLKPSRSQNFDLHLSVYENYIGLFTLGGFYKEIDDLVFSTGRRAILDPEEYGLPPSASGLMVNTNVNNDFTVDLWGIEVDWQTHFWYLPGPLRGLVLNANYTHTISEAKYPRTEIKTEYLMQPPWVTQTNVDSFYTTRLVDQPNDIVNLSIGYDYKGFSIRLSMLYQSDIFTGANFWPELRNNTDDYMRWDLAMKQKLPIKGLQLFFNLNNITDALDRSLYHSSSFPNSEEFYGKTIDVGLRYRL